MAGPNTRDSKRSNRSAKVSILGRQFSRAFHVAALPFLILVFLGLVFLLPLRTTIQLGGDEGFELAKATLSLKGFRLYTDVWNDQPPLHTFLLTQTLKHVSPSILGPRLISVGFACLLLVSAFLMARKASGLMTATFITTLIILSPGFLTLGSSCMLEVPCVSTALAALCVLFLGNLWRWRINEITAGALFGVACEIKLIGAVFLPVAALIVWLHRRNTATFKPWSLHFLKPVIASLFVVGASALVSFVAIDWFVDNGAFIKHFGQTWTSHFGGTKSTEYGSPADHPFDWMVLLRNWDATVPAIVGIVFCFLRFRTSPLLPLPAVWLLFDLALFSIHRPWWSYYYVHISPPLCWCAAIGIIETLRLAQARRKRAVTALTVVFLLGATAWMGWRVVGQIQNVRHSPQTYSTLALKELERFKPFTKFLYADQPIYSFHSGIPLIPDLAVVMLKRLWSGEMTNAKIADEMEAVKPELILLENDTRVLPFQKQLQSEYRLVYQDSIHRLYALKSIVNKAEY